MFKIGDKVKVNLHNGSIQYGIISGIFIVEGACKGGDCNLGDKKYDIGNGTFSKDRIIHCTDEELNLYFN